MQTDDVRFRIAAARRMLYRAGCDSNISGHVSQRADGEDAFWITPFQFFDQTLPRHVVKMSFDMQLLEGDQAVSPAVEFHVGIYRHRPDVQAIVHTHSKYVAVVASTGRTIGMYNVGSALFHDDQAYYSDLGDEAIEADRSDRLAEALGDKHVLLFSNHGAVTVGDSLELATVRAMLLEEAAWYHLQCEAAGGKQLIPGVIRRNKLAYRKYFVPNMWRCSFERLRVSDPALFEGVADHA